MQSSHELLPSIDLFLHIADGTIQQIETILILHVYLSYDFKDVLSDLIWLFIYIVPSHEEDGDD